MNGEDLFRGLNYVNAKFIDEAETATQLTGEKKILSLRRPVLIAAIIAMLMLLVGCTIVYMLSLKEVKLGDQTVVRDIYEYDPNSGEAVSYVGQETYTQQVLTLAGMSGTPVSKAAQEWYAFLESYDTDREIQKSVWDNYPNFPAEYAGYGLYTQEMRDKLDELLEKYNLKLRGEQIEFQTSKLLFRALGMENVLNAESRAKIQVNHTAYYENGNLDVYFEITIPESDGTDSQTTNGYLYYRPKDCFIPDTAILTDAEWEEWNYTTASGDKVLILYSEGAGSAWIFADTASCTASLRLDIVKRMAAEKGNSGQTAKFELMTKEQLEQVADAIDFSVEPQLIEGWESLSDGSAPAGQEINGYRIDVESAFTDGYGYRIVLRITAPESIALTDPDDYSARTDAGAGVYGNCIEDGDGKLNTCHYILQDYTSKYDRPEDGSLPYPEGSIIPIYWEDLYYSYYDFGKQQEVKNILTEGTWKFDIPLNEADTREIELLTEPIIAKGCTGWKMDGTDVLEDLEVTSIKLRSLGIDLVSENESADFFCFTGQFSYLVMKDASWVEFTWYELNTPIDLDKVAYVQLADKTILPMPGVGAETVEMISEMVKAAWDAEYVPAPVFSDGIELLSEPITMKSLGGYVTDPSGYMEPLYEYLTMTSIILHPDGLAILGPAAFDSPDNQATVVMKDGSEILLTGMGGSPYCDEPMSQLKAESMIDLSQVDHVMLPDGTKLMLNNAK